MDFKTGIEEYYVIKNKKKLQFGFTTGTCAAAAAQAAVRMLLSGVRTEEVSVLTPKGILLRLLVEEIRIEKDAVSCAVRKDAGDDPDTTNGILIYARAEKKREAGIEIDGGIGIGRITKPGLEQNVGEAAINRVPRAMIQKAALQEASSYAYQGGLKIVISAPEGEKIAQKTFNPRLGILGGISILGTTGIVEPMSEKALIDSIRVEMRQRKEQGESYLLMTPGNYGAAYLQEHLTLPFEKNIKCSNYIGETIDMAVDMGIQGILFVSHIGKFVKVAAGIMNTHSHSADARMETLCANAVRAGGDLLTARRILDCATTDEALEVLKDAGILKDTMEEILKRIQFYLDHRSYEQILLGAVLFSNEQGYLGQTRDAGALIRYLEKERKTGENLCRENYTE